VHVLGERIYVADATDSVALVRYNSLTNTLETIASGMPKEPYITHKRALRHPHTPKRDPFSRLLRSGMLKGLDITRKRALQKSLTSLIKEPYITHKRALRSGMLKGLDITRKRALYIRVLVPRVYSTTPKMSC